MSQAFINGAPKEPKNPNVTIAIVCLHPAETLLDCLESLAAQTYNNFDVIILYKESTGKEFFVSRSSSLVSKPNFFNESVQEIITQAQTKFTSYKYLNLDINKSLGETYNYLVDIATGEYFFQFPADCIAIPDMLEKLVTAASKFDADAVVCPQITLGEDGELEKLALVDGSLLKLLEFNYNRDVIALFSVKLLQEFPYSQERGLLALNWHILAAAIAQDKQIAYPAYPLYIIANTSFSAFNQVNLPKERYYLRQYLYQIEPSKWKVIFSYISNKLATFTR